MQTPIGVYDTHNSQRERMIELLKANGYCYTQQLVGLGIYQYNARIKELREAGHQIESTKINGKFGFIYKL